MLRKLIAEWLGTFSLLATVVGSGIMAERLADGNVAIALLGNTIPTGAILVVLITIFGPISGAHFNPAVTLSFLLRREIAPGAAGLFVLAQIVGGIFGVFAAHVMFDNPIIDASSTDRTGIGQWAGEFVAHVWPGRHHSGVLARASRLRAGRSWPVHHRGLLVHLFDFVRQSGRNHRTGLLRHLCRDQSVRRAALCSCSTGRRGAGNRVLRLVSGGRRRRVMPGSDFDGKPTVAGGLR